MREQPELNEQEWRLVLELLDAERRELPTEIRHTDSHQVHERLAQRLTLVSALVDRLRPAVAAQ